MGGWEDFWKGVGRTLGIIPKATYEAGRGVVTGAGGGRFVMGREAKKREKWFNATQVAMAEVIDAAEKLLHEITGTLKSVHEEVNQLCHFARTLPTGSTKKQIEQWVQYLGQQQSAATPPHNTPASKWPLAYYAVPLENTISAMKGFYKDFVAGKTSYVETPDATDLHPSGATTNRAMIISWENDFWQIVEDDLELLMTNASKALEGFSQAMQYIAALREQALKAHKAPEEEKGKPSTGGALDALDIDF